VFYNVDREAAMVWDEGDDEILAMRSNAELMEFLSACGERAKIGPRKSLAAIRATYAPPAGGRDGLQRSD
jgi:hypothetical protein